MYVFLLVAADEKTLLVLLHRSGECQTTTLTTSVLNVSKQNQLHPTNATLLGLSKSFLFRLWFQIFALFLPAKMKTFLKCDQ